MEAELDAILLKIAQNEAMRDLKSNLFDESMELLQDIFGDEGITIEDWMIDQPCTAGKKFRGDSRC